MIRYKTAAEIAGIAESGKIIARVFTELESLVRPGVTTAELNSVAEKIIRRHGGKPAFLGYQGFPASICASVNDVVVHGIPDDTPLQNGDIVGVDVGVEKNGFFADAARTFTAGTVRSEVRALLDLTQAALAKAIATARIGNTIGDIGFAVQTMAEAQGYGVVRELIGHGVGFALHEEPPVPNYGRKGSGFPIREGLVIAIEPMINLGTGDVLMNDHEWPVLTADGLVSAHFENTIAVTKDGPQILTQ